MAKQKTDLQVFQEWVQELTGFVFGTEEKPKRARGKKGRYKADDPTTKEFNEAWVGGKAPKKRKKNVKK